MEGLLFGISIWCGIYGQALRMTFRDEELVSKRITSMLFNSLFWATALAIFGMLLSSYFELNEPAGLSMYTVTAVVAGLIIGAVIGFYNSKDRERREVMLRDNLEWADTGFSAILLASFVMFFIVQAFKIPSGSMRMTLIQGDHLFVNKFIYGIPVPLSQKKVAPLRQISRGDIVIFRFPSEDPRSPHYKKDFIKRVVATQGQTVQVIDKEVYVDGQKQIEPFKQNIDPFLIPKDTSISPEEFQHRWESGQLAESNIRDNFGPVVVPPGHLFVMGDNRDQSFDSRFWGPLPMGLVKGKAWFLYFPLNRMKVVR